VTKAIRDAVKGPLVIDGVQIEGIGHERVEGVGGDGDHMPAPDGNRRKADQAFCHPGRFSLGLM